MRIAACLLFFSLLCTACDPGETSDGDADRAGSFSVRVSGESVLTPDLDRTLSGRALFAVTQVDGVERLTIELQDDSGAIHELIALTAAGAARPAPGTYPADAPFEGEAGAFTVQYIRDQTSPDYTEFFHGTGGSIVITTSSSNRMAGRLTGVTAVAGGLTVTLRGEFDARPGH